MMNTLFLYLLLGLSTLISSEKPGFLSDKASRANRLAYKWTKVRDEGPWKKSYNFQMFSHNDTLWVFHTDGNWFSVDGNEWRKSSLPNAIANLAFLDYVPFNGSIFGLGRFDGNIERYTFQPVIYRTNDLKHWQTAASQSNLPRRFFYHPFVFQNKNLANRR